ncbi:glycosyltransferase family 4 protein [Paenarthrobacter nicotinovorans]|uniref:glycosyltransferase family 4 protein n=1 Tax=Paenarthrobacter nicotinovorans TaxID=29320 RepID=UPI00382584CA
MSLSRFNFFSDAFYPDWTGGLQRYATELVAEAASQGHHGAIWTRAWRSSGLSEVEDLVGNAFSINEVFPLIPRRLRGIALLFAGLFGPIKSDANAEVCVFHTSVLGAAFMNPGSKSRQIYVFHASAGHELLVEAASSGRVGMVTKLKAAMLLHLERKCLTRADAVVVLSEFSRNLMRELHPRHVPERIVVIPGGTHVPEVPDLDVRLGQGPKSRRIVVLRRLEWRMGIDILLSAFAASLARQQGWVLDIVGTGSQESMLQAQAQELGLGESVVFHGRVSEERRIELLDGASLSVLPTRALEGFGLSTVEAMARGVVPIVTSAGASPELVSGISPRLVCEPTEEGLRDAIDYWAVESSQELIDELGRDCLMAARRYDWKSVFSGYEALLDSTQDL